MNTTAIIIYLQVLSEFKFLFCLRMRLVETDEPSSKVNLPFSFPIIRGQVALASLSVAGIVSFCFQILAILLGAPWYFIMAYFFLLL